MFFHSLSGKILKTTDPPSQSLGIPDPAGGYNPLWDEELPPQARGPAFGKWAASYFHHDDLASRDFTKLNQRNPDIDRKPTVETMTQEVLFSVTDFAPGSKCETILVEPAFENILAAQTEKALFDQATRKEWGGTKFWHIYGSANTWNIIYSVWILEKKAGPSGLNFKLMEGANHLVSITTFIFTPLLTYCNSSCGKIPRGHSNIFRNVSRPSRLDFSRFSFELL